MSEARAIGSDTPTGRMLRFTAFAFGAMSYLTLLFTILYAVGFSACSWFRIGFRGAENHR